MRSKNRQGSTRPTRRPKSDRSRADRSPTDPAFDQLDLLKRSYPECPQCQGTGKRIETIAFKGHSTNHEWAMIKFRAQALENWDKMDVKMKSFIEKKISQAKYYPPKITYAPCYRCRGSGRLLPEVEKVREEAERLQQAWYRFTGQSQ